MRYKQQLLGHSKKRFSSTGGGAGEAAIIGEVNVTITGKGNMKDMLRMGRHIRRRARAIHSLKLMIKRKELQKRKVRISSPLSRSHPSCRSRRTGSLRKVSRGTSI